MEVVELPVRRAGVYVPGGRAPYPSTVVMGAVTARAAGVDEIAVCAPPGPGGEAHPVILAACVLCEVTEVYRMGGAQAIAALAYGTESVAAVDVIAGPGNAVRAGGQAPGARDRGDRRGGRGPASSWWWPRAGADPELVALDLLAQAEHGEDSPLWCVSPDQGLLDASAAAVERLAPARPSVPTRELQLVDTDDVRAAVRIADEIAPEHLELVGDEAEALAGPRARAPAACSWAGARPRRSATTWPGSNHVLPTGGAARFQSALSPATFRRRMARVSLPGEAAARLAPAGAALARAEGFPVHAESMERRA